MRRKQLRRLVIGCAAATGVLVPFAAPAQAAPPTPAATIAAVAWAPCEEDAAAQCGTLAVPVDWARPAGPTIKMAVARRPATDPGARLGSLIVNPGGPGGSGVDSVLYGHYGDNLRSHFDIVGFDPRGVARSNPILCSLEAINRLVGPIHSQAAFDQMVAASRDLAKDCRARTGPIFDHVDTLQVVRDIDALRQAVGDPKLSFLGFSYGTLMAQQYAEMFPDKVRAIVGDSNMDHSNDVRGFVNTQTATGQDTFSEFVAGCGRMSNCALYGRDIRQFWKRLLERARLHELPDPDDRTYAITELDLINYVLRNLNYQPYWVGIASELVRLDEGRPSTTLRAASVEAEEPVVVPFAFQAVFCQDWNLTVRSYTEWNSIATAAKRFSPDLPEVPRAYSGAICLGWPTPATNPQRAITARNTTKLLLVNSRHDPATGYNWAVSAAAQFGGKAVLLTYEGWGHIVYGRTACADDIIERYLVSQVLPANGSTCAAVPPPDSISAASDTPTNARNAATVQPGSRDANLIPFRAESELPTWLAS